MKKYFTIITIFIFFILLCWIVFNFNKDNTSQLEAKVDSLTQNLTPGVIEILNPTFISKGLDENPYKIAAKKGIQINEDIELYTVTGKFTNKDKKLIYISADKGFYNQNQQVIELNGNVLIYDDLGNKTSTENAIIDIEIKKIVLTNKVISVTDKSQIQSNSATVDDENDLIIYTGRVRVKIKNE
jgi:hypothetical protein